jgi:hypothetical protein
MLLRTSYELGSLPSPINNYDDQLCRDFPRSLPSAGLPVGPYTLTYRCDWWLMLLLSATRRTEFMSRIYKSYGRPPRTVKPFTLDSHSCGESSRGACKHQFIVPGSDMRSGRGLARDRKAPSGGSGVRERSEAGGVGTGANLA